jgi:RNA polymerase sigma-70 factor (ECF subfamily)
MSASASFRELLERVRGGDAAAAEELVRSYESDIRIAVRMRLSDPALRRQFDSIDVCQSVLASFFFRAAAGQYDLHDPGQLVALLTRMAQNKLAMHARSHYRQRRDVRRQHCIADGAGGDWDKAPGPVQEAMHRELLERAYELMDPEVREIADGRVRGQPWETIAAELGGTAEARRKQYSRAIDRIAERLEIE